MVVVLLAGCAAAGSSPAFEVASSAETDEYPGCQIEMHIDVDGGGGYDRIIVEIGGSGTVFSDSIPYHAEAEKGSKVTVYGIDMGGDGFFGTGPGGIDTIVEGYINDRCEIVET